MTPFEYVIVGLVALALVLGAVAILGFLIELVLITFTVLWLIAGVPARLLRRVRKGIP